jgi:hypothetical protein
LGQFNARLGTDTKQLLLVQRVNLRALVSLVNFDLFWFSLEKAPEGSCNPLLCREKERLLYRSNFDAVFDPMDCCYRIAMTHL